MKQTIPRDTAHKRQECLQLFRLRTGQTAMAQHHSPLQCKTGLCPHSAGQHAWISSSSLISSNVSAHFSQYCVLCGTARTKGSWKELKVLGLLLGGGGSEVLVFTVWFGGFVWVRFILSILKTKPTKQIHLFSSSMTCQQQLSLQDRCAPHPRRTRLHSERTWLLLQ